VGWFANQRRFDFLGIPPVPYGFAQSDRSLSPHTASVAAAHHVSATAAPHLHHWVHVVAL
jgi:hypothetical protein